MKMRIPGLEAGRKNFKYAVTLNLFQGPFSRTNRCLDWIQNFKFTLLCSIGNSGEMDAETSSA
jgi:hypothetical protein